MRCTTVGAWIALSLTQICGAQSTVSRVEPVSLTVRRTPKIEGVQVFGEPGVELQLAALVRGKPILSVDAAASALVRFVDDKGTDLAAGAPKGFFSWVRLANAFREEPTESCLLDIRTETLPAAGAARIELEAKVALVTASGTVSGDQNIRMEKGAEITCGPTPMRLGDVEEGDGGADVQVVSDAPMDAVKEIAFLDGAGRVIQSTSTGSGSFGFAGKKTYTRSYRVTGDALPVKVRVVAHANVEKVVLPVKLTIGVGLQ